MSVSLAIAAALLFQSAGQFDLVCTGHTETFSTGNPTPSSMEANDRMAVDLDRGLWCWNECITVSPMVEANAAELIFSQEEDDKVSHFIRVDRITGKYWISLKAKRENGDVINLTTDGRCTKAPYTPIPQAVF
jgi:hypothetical protein